METNLSPQRVLLVDDNPDDRLLIARELEKEFPQIRIDQVLSEDELKDHLQAPPCDLVITDYELRWSDGLTVLKQLKQRSPDYPVIMFTASGDEETAVAAMKAGVDDYIVKSPKHYVRLPMAARNCLAHAARRRSLQEAEVRYAQLFERVPLGLWTADAGGRLEEVNSCFAAYFGERDRGTLTGTPLADLFSERGAALQWEELVSRRSDIERFRSPLRRRDGSEFWGEIRARFERGGDGRPSRYEGYLDDVTRRLEAEAERNKLLASEQEQRAALQALNESLEQRVVERTAVAEQRAKQLQALASELTHAEQRERRRLAVILHDNLQQLIAAARLQLGRLRSQVSMPLQPQVQAVEELLQQSIDTSRSLAVDLAPPVLYDAGLSAALRWLARWVQQRMELRVRLDLQTDVQPADVEISAFLLHAVRQLLLNVKRHSGVCEADVRLGRSGEESIEVTVEDAGIGFDTAAFSREQSEALGLFSIRERLENLGGQMHLDSAPGRGTRVRLVCPIVIPPARGGAERLRS